MAATTPADFIDIYETVLSYLNIDAQQNSIGAGASDAVNVRYKKTLIEKEIREQDWAVAQAICNTLGHSKRPAFFSEVTSTSRPVILPDTRVGEPEIPLIEVSSGLFKAGEPLSTFWIETLNNDSSNAFGDSSIKSGYYEIVGSQAFFTGISIKIKICTPIKSTTNICISPQEYSAIIKNLSLANLYAKQGNFPEAASWYLTRGLQGLQMLMENKVIIPTFEAYQKQ